jgi:hypothetical protein
MGRAFGRDGITEKDAAVFHNIRLVGNNWSGEGKCRKRVHTLLKRTEKSAEEEPDA